MRMTIVGLAATAVLGAQLFTTAVSTHAGARSDRADASRKNSFRDCPDCPEMEKIPAGSFTIGAPPEELGKFVEEGPQRRINIPQFAIGKFDVTRGQWAAFVSATKRSTIEGCDYSGFPEDREAKASWNNLGFSQDDKHPVVCVTWSDAQAYVQWLSQKTGRKYRLPTESEWEYAARAGTTTPYPWGSTPTHENANYGSEKCCSGLAAGRDRWVNTSPAGSFPPNAFGLYDMHGNVLQWVQDCFSSSYSDLPPNGSAYEKNVQLKLTGDLADMTGQNSCSYRMLRGGDWGDPPTMIRSAYRNFAPPPGTTLQKYRSAGVGLRVASTLY